MDFHPADKDRISALSKQLRSISRPLRILRNLAWPQAVKAQFFTAQAEQLPIIDYAPFDPRESLQQLSEFKRGLKGQPLEGWFEQQAEVLENTAHLLANRGKPEFLHYSHALYGTPTDPVLDGKRTVLELAEAFDQVIQGLCHMPLNPEPEAVFDATAVAEKMHRFTQRLFGQAAPKIQVVDDLSANALASSKRIRIRRSARFNDKDLDQLTQHEAGIHVATSLNGRAQQHLPFLATSHAGTTKTQEGLAVFAEFITGSIDLDRLRRLADRVIAIQMAIDGADFIQVYRYFLSHDASADQAYESARRVFRGGIVSGGVPFTKDQVYLDGLIRVHNFLRTIVAENRADCLSLLFCGKLDLDDIPILCQLAAVGLVEAPRFLPPWSQDSRFLISYLAYSGFLNSIELEKVRAYYREALSRAPLIQLS